MLITPATPAMIESAPDDVAFVARDLEAHELAWFALEANDVVAAMRVSLQSGANGRDITGPHVVLDTLAVAASHRREGWGRAMLHFLDGWLRTQPHLPQAIGLGVEVDNRAAIALYECQHYEVVVDAAGAPVSFPSSTLGKTCVVMLKRLTGPLYDTEPS